MTKPRPDTILRQTLTIALFLLLSLAAGRLSHAQQVQPAPGGVTQNDVNEVARELWCPLCSGVRLDACELKACDQMKDVIEIKLGEGETLQSIKEYFVQQYGPQVLGEPPLEGFNWLAWILPVVVLVGGGAFLYSRARRVIRMTPATEPAADAGPLPPVDAEFARKLDEELKEND